MENKTWWYAINNEKKGPVSESELLLLREHKGINSAAPYYQQEFQKIILSGESYTGKWCGRRGTWIFYHAKIKSKQIPKSLV